jgi:hypothetical protein
MSLRMWPALASWGAGLIHLAVAAAAPPAVLALFVLIGAAEIVWGVLVLRADGLVAPRIVLGAAVAIVAASVAAALAGVMAWLPLASSTVFVVFIAGACALAVRRGARNGSGHVGSVEVGVDVGPVSAGPVGAGPVGAGPVGAGPVSAGPVGAGPVGAGPVGAGPVGAGPVSAGPVGAGPVVGARVGAGSAIDAHVGAGGVSADARGLAASAARDRREPRPGRTIAGLLAGAAIVAALTTPALAATDAGEHAVPHGEMPGHSAH